MAAKAEADLAAAEMLLAAGNDFILLNACYIAQQCIEKPLKAILIKRAVNLQGRMTSGIS